MPKLVTGASSAGELRAISAAAAARGFTLVEMLVVVVIAGILTGTVLLGLGRPGPGQANRQALDRLAASLEVMCDQALLSGTARGLRFQARGYDFWRHFEGRWQPLSNTDRPAAARWPGDLRARVQIEGLALRAAGDARGPQVVCTGIEPPTPFSVELGRGGQRRQLRWPE